MKEPLERAAVPQVRLGYWIALFVGVLVIAAFLFPGAVAIVGVILALPIIIFLHELGALRHGQALGHEGHRVLRRVRAAPVVDAEG